MTNELSIQQKVVMTRNGAVFYMTAERADRLHMMLQSANKPEYVEIDDTLIAVREITMIAPASKVEEMNKRKQGFWQCAKGHWHSRDETVCKSGWGTDTSNTKTQIEDPPLSEEEKARGARIKELMDSGMSLAKSIAQARDEFSKPSKR